MTDPHGTPKALSVRTVVSICLGIAICGLLAWQVYTMPAKPHGHVSVTFLGVTNDPVIGTAARFELTNEFGRPIGFSTGPVEVRGSSGWPSGTNHSYYVATHLDPAYEVFGAGSQRFSVPLSNINSEVTWRVPLVYGKVGSTMDHWVDELKTTLRMPVGGPVWWTNTPEVHGVSDPGN